MRKIFRFIFILTFFFFFSTIVAKAEDVGVTYQTHIQNIGWQDWVSNGNMSGTQGQSLRLEGIKIYLQNQPYSGDIVYQTHVQNVGWQDWTSNGNMSGTQGRSLRLEAIKINLTGEMAEHYDVYYRVHVQNFGWLGWAYNGNAAGSAGYGYRLEGINVVIVPKGSSAPGSTWNSYYEKMPTISYQTHIQNIGWQGYVSDGNISGTEGRSLRLEGLKIHLDNGIVPGTIVYQTHVQNIGWQNWVNNEMMSGTTGQSLRLEAIKIYLTGELAQLYDIYYRVHVENIGWTGWTSNGEAAGSEGYGYRMEAVQIRLIRKGDPTPEIDYSAFHLKPQFNFYVNNGVKSVYNNYVGLIANNVSKIIDVSVHNKDIHWNAVKKTDVDGVILRVGYGSYSEDSNFGAYLSEVQRLGIPYGIYLFSYAESGAEAEAEANFVINEIAKYNLNPTLGVYYDIESWCIGSYCPYISADAYNDIITTFMNKTRAAGIESWVYTGLNYSKTRLHPEMLQYVRWIAQYNTTCNYTGYYTMWQYSSTERISGIPTNVDVNIKFN